MMKISVCIGSSCHVKGAGRVVENFHKLIADNNLGDKVELGGSFCTNNCQKGVCITVDGQVFSVNPEECDSFFMDNIIAKLGK